ncbi:hypothetical protein [Nocardioides dongxiaopingii]|uniref:hypothetical protein n=1 Tax=Nocardioides dongxiaopingii TaxID=2576036 RepID=UPI0010C766E6|nr:hypothetical protein [Nocardioides dongxiaopingii]
MVRALRAVRAHGGALTLLAVTSAALVAAVVLAVLATGPDGRPATVLPLLLLGLVVVPVPTVELARSRRAEVTLVRVRGAAPGRVLGAVAGPAAAAVVVGAVTGAVGALAGAAVLRERWDLPASPGATPWAWGGVAAGVALLTAVACSAAVAREPLATALVRPGWRRAAGVVDVVAGVALLVAVGVVVQQSLAGAPGAGEAPPGGAVVLAGSAVLGVAAGHALVVGLSTLVPALAAGGRSSAVLLALRRVVSGDQRARTRAVVAAGVVAVAALTATTAAGGWADRTARLDLGGPVRVALDDTDALSALLLTRDLDPEGRWLMAVAFDDSRTEAELRIAWLDLARYERVSGDFLAGAGADVGPGTGALRAAPAVVPVTGDAVTVARVDPARAVTVSLTLLTADAGLDTATVVLGAGEAAGTVAVSSCARACVVVGLAATAPVEVSGLGLGTTDLLAAAWTRAEPSGGPTGGTVDGPAGSSLTLDPGAPLAPSAATAPIPVLTAGRPAWPDAGPAVPGIGGGSRPATATGDRTALPLVGAAGLLADLPTALAGAVDSVSGVQVLVLARADTPADVLAGLRDAGGVPVGLGGGDAALEGSWAAERHARSVVAVGAGALGLLVLLAGRRRRSLATRRDEAVLRLVGVPRHERRRADVLETGVLAGTTLLATAAAGCLAAVTVVAATELVPTGVTRPPLGPTVEPWVLLLGALGTAAAAALGGVLVRVGTARHSDPARLLEEES